MPMLLSSERKQVEKIIETLSSLDSQEDMAVE